MIGRIQEQLESIYGFRLEQRASEFVVGREAALALGATGRSDEELLVHEEGGELEVALYLSDGLLEELARYERAPAERFLERALDSYCRMAEGVSHFLYLAFSAELGRTVTLLELEAQAEVDKFASCILSRWRTGAASWVKELHHRLFDAVTYDPRLTGDERWRYEEANRLSRHYCERLIPHVLHRRMDRLLSALRYSYRLGAEAKLQHLAA